MRKLVFLALFSLLAGFAWLLLPDPDSGRLTAMQGQVATGRGLIVGIDKNGGTVTISHEPLRDLNMPAMTMGFSVRDLSLLSNLQVGQRVEFGLVHRDWSYVITHIK